MLRTMVDDLKNQLGSTIVVLATVADGKVSLIAGVSKDVTDRVKAGELVGMVAQQVGGKGAVVRIWRRPVVPMRLLSLQR